MSNEQHKEIQRLKDIINRARTAFCCSENDDHQAALRTLEILDEDSNAISFPSESSELYVEFCYVKGDPPFICGSVGNVTISTLEEIEQDFIDNEDSFDMGDGNYLLKASRNPGQQSFPETGQWDFPPHWECDFVGFKGIEP